jgi:hypothetical protein
MHPSGLCAPAAQAVGVHADVPLPERHQQPCTVQTWMPEWNAPLACERHRQHARAPFPMPPQGQGTLTVKPSPAPAPTSPAAPVPG